MLLGVISRIKHERRRLLFVTLMAFFAGFIMYLRSDLYLGGWHISWVTGSIYAVVVGLSALTVCLVLPAMRFMVEAVAISRLTISVLVLSVPELGPVLTASPLLMAFTVVMGGFLISRGLHGRILRDRAENWRERLLPRGGFQRHPARIVANPWQTRFVGWMDDAVPVRV